MPNIPAPKNGARHQVIAYYRVSKREAFSGSHTLDTQETRIRQYLDQRLGAGSYDVKPFSDDGVSGGYGPHPTGSEKRTRPTLAEISALLLTGKYDIFIVYDMSRFARSVRVSKVFQEDVLRPSKTLLLSTCEDIDLETPEGEFNADIQGAVNALTRNKTKKRVQDAAAMRQEEGYLHGQVGYGWQWQPLWEVPTRGRRGIAPKPEEGKWVVHAKDRLLAGWSLAKIVREFNDLGVRSPSGMTTWAVDVLRRILRNPLHAGLIRAKEKLIEGQHTAQRYYDREIYEQIEQRFEERKKLPTNTSKAEQYLLNGLVTCAKCGKRLYPTKAPDKPHATYACLAGMNKGVQACPRVRIGEAALDALVIEEVARLSQEPAMQELLREEAQQAVGDEDVKLRAQRQQVETRLKELQEQFTRWADAFSRGSMTESQFAAFNQTLQSQQQEAEAKRAAIEQALETRYLRERRVSQAHQMLLQFPQVWEHLLPPEQRAVMQQLLEYVRIERQEAGIVAHLKVLLLPARAEFLPDQRVQPRKRKTTTLVAALTPRHLALLHWLNEGKTLREAAGCMNIIYSTVRQFVMQIRKLMGEKDLLEIARQARGRIHAELSTLPLHGFQGPQEVRVESGSERVYVSPKLMEVLPLYASGAQTKEIARLTGLEMTTVTGRRTRLLEVFQATTMYEVAQKAKKMGLL